MATSLKQTTLLTGLAVAKYPHRSLNHLYSKLIRALDKLPPTYPYRIHTEKLVKERAALVSCTPDVTTLEEKIGCGQVEELIVQAENELLLVRKMSIWKPWEPLIEAPKDQWVWPPHK